MHKIQKFLQSLPKELRKKLFERLALLQKNPYDEALDIKKLKGNTPLFRLRVGKIRIIYKINKDTVVEIIDIDWRGNIY